jgi:hypothetical protein
VFPYLTGTSLDETSSKTPWKRNANGQLIQEALERKEKFDDSQDVRDVFCISYVLISV